MGKKATKNLLVPFGTIIEAIKGDTRSLDYSSNGGMLPNSGGVDGGSR